MKILTINPGSTSTKIAVFEDLNEVFTKTLRHSAEELADFDVITDQFEFRKNIIIEALKENNIELSSLDAIAGRGGMLKPIAGGVYRVNDEMIKDLKIGVQGEHASNLGGILAKNIAAETANKDNAFIVDPVVVDELQDLARFSGHPDLPRASIFHALNQKAVARRHSREIGKKYEDLNLIVVHLGGGISVGSHRDGRVIDVNQALNGEGPFSPERTGTIPAFDLAKLCFSGKYQLHEVKKMITGRGGCVAYLDTNDAREIEDRAVAGEEKALMVYKAMAYQISKDIGANATVLHGKVDGILITGGIAYSKILVEWIKEAVQFIGDVYVYPGEDEMQALCENLYYALQGEMEIKEYV